MVPEGWNTLSVGRIARVIRGASPRPKGDSRYYGGNIPRLMVADVTRDGKYVIPKIDFLTETGAQQSRMMPAGTLTIVCSGTVGIPSILAVDACIHDGFLALAEISDNYDIEYLYYVFSRLQRDFDSVATHGGVFTNLTTSILKEFTILLPPISEQKKIAAILSSVDNAIQATQAMIDQTRRVKQGLMQQLLTRGIGHTRFKQTEIGEIPEEWLEGTLGDYLKEIKGGGTPSRKKTTYWEGAIPWGSVKDLTGAYLDNTEEYITEEGLKNSASNLIPAGTVIIATRMALGKVIRFSCDVAINQDLKALYPIKELSSDFLFYWLLLQASLIETLGAGSTVKGIRLESLRALKLMLPPIDEQKKIVAILTGVDEVLNTEQDKMLQLNKIKKGLMQDLLTGRVRVKLDEVNTT